MHYFPHNRFSTILFFGALIAAISTAQFSDAAKRANGKSRRGVSYEKVELFKAMESGDIDVKLIPKDAKQATVIFKNNTKKPLSIQLPAAFAGVPVLAQDDGGFGSDNSSNGGAAQSMGGGMGMMGGMGGGGMGMMGGGMFNVPPDSTRKTKVVTVCLEHGKPDPNPRIPYELRPIESVVKDNHAVIEICKMLANRKISQHAAQAAAWHLTDGLTWQQLAVKIKKKHLNGTRELYFNQLDLRRAFAIVQEATKRAKKYEDRKESTSPGEIDESLTATGA